MNVHTPVAHPLISTRGPETGHVLPKRETSSDPGRPTPPLDPRVLGAEGRPAVGPTAPLALDPLRETSDDEFTVDGLLKEWGQKNSRYDVDGSGVVDMADLIALLEKLSTAAAAADPVPDEAEDAPVAADAPSLATDAARTGDAADPGAPLTVEGLMAAWGSGDERFDINRDGTVNMADLVKLLGKLSAGRGPAEPQLVHRDAPVGIEGPSLDNAAATSGPVEPASGDPLSVDGLLEAWGGSDATYDLDGNGTVNMADLVALLARLNTTPPAEAAPGAPADALVTPHGALTDAALVEPESAPPALTVEGLLEAWGTRDGSYDLDGNGTVNMADLLALLQSRPEVPDVLAGDLPGAPTGAGEANATSPASAGTRLAQLADALFDRLSNRGFAAQPPSNLHDIVSKLDLPEGHERKLLAELGRRYPRGSG